MVVLVFLPRGVGVIVPEERGLFISFQAVESRGDGTTFLDLKVDIHKVYIHKKNQCIYMFKWPMQSVVF